MKRKSYRKNGGSALSEISHGKRLWLSLILSFICAVLLCCAFLLPLNSRTASAAVNASDVVTWEGIQNYQLYKTDYPGNGGYGTSYTLSEMGAPNSSRGVSSFDAATATASGSKENLGVAYYVVSYVKFKAKVKIPARTDYTVKFSVSMYINGVNTAGSGHAWIDLYSFGETDKSDDVTFGYISGGGTLIDYVTPADVQLTHKSVSSTTEGSQMSYPAEEAYLVTLTNNSNVENTKTLYFGCILAVCPGTSYSYWFNSTATMSSEILATKALVPEVDKSSDTYNADGNVFAFAYDSNKVELKSVKYTPVGGSETDIKNSTTIAADGTCTLKGVGDYTFTFALKDKTNYEWESGGTADKTIPITIIPQTVAVPSAEGGTTQTYDPTNGNQFHIDNYDDKVMTLSGGTLTNHVITFESAGTVTLTFKLKDGFEWEDGETKDKTIKLTVSPIQLTAPTITNSPLTYDKNGSIFTVSGYDSKTMTADKVTDGISWNGTGFKATDAKTYTVKFALKDKTNYAWSGGSTEDVEATAKVNPKSVDVVWTSQKTQIGDDALFAMLPALDVTDEVAALLTQVQFYLEDNCTISGTTATATGDPVTSVEKNKNYYAVVQIKTDEAKNNYTFNGNLYVAFHTNDERTVVKVTLEEGEAIYNRNPQKAKVSVKTTGGVDLTAQIDLQYEYYLGETKLAGAPTDAGDYKVVVSIKAADASQYTTTDNLEFTFTIKQAEPTLDPSFISTGHFAGGDLPQLSYGGNGTPGTYAWDNPDEKLGSGERSYGYTFTPTDTKNYKTVQSSVKISAADAMITSISAEFDFPEDLIIYDSWKPDDLRQYLNVTGTKNDGTTQDNITGYAFLQSVLVEGKDVKLTVNYGTNTCIVTIPEVVKCELAEILAVCTPERTVYTSTNINTLKQWITVTGKNNDGSAYSGTISGLDCTLTYGEDNKLTAGTITITVTYNGLTTTCTVPVTEVALGSITASFANSLEVEDINSKTSEEKLRELIKVVGTNNDGSAYNGGEEITEYTIDTAMEGTTLQIYISYNGLHTELEKEVEPEPEEGDKTRVPQPKLPDKEYTGSEIDILAGWKYSNLVTAIGNNEIDIGTYEIVLTLNEPDKYKWADAEGDSITLTYEIVKRKITISIDPVSSEAGAELAELTATVIEGSIIEGDTPYILVCYPDKDIIGEYPITLEYAEGYEDIYEIEWEDGVYTVYKKLEDPSGGGEIELPVDINVAFKVTQSEAAGDYSALEGYKIGYWAQLWYRNEDGTLGDEFTDELNCVLTLSIPTKMIDAIRGGEEINREKIAQELKLYYAVDVGFKKIENFKIVQKEDETWQVSFNYDDKFRAEIVFDAPNAEEPTEPKDDTWLIWLLASLSAALVCGIIAVIIVVARRRSGDDDEIDEEDYDEDYDDQDDGEEEIEEEVNEDY